MIDTQPSLEVQEGFQEEWVPGQHLQGAVKVAQLMKDVNDNPLTGTM